jgi:dual specificity phosphatase 12
MATKILDTLYLGDASDAELLTFTNPLNIGTVVNVSLGQGEPADGILNVHVPMEDGEISARSFNRALKAIEENLNAGRRVLVRCVMGISRSVVVVALHLAITDGTSFEASLDRVKKLRVEADPSPEAVDSAKQYLKQRNRKLKKSTSGGSQ